MRAAWIALAALTAAAAAAAAETFETSAGPVVVTKVAGGLENPWALAFLPDGRILVTERPGRLRIVEDGRVSRPVAGLPEVYARGQGGLLDVAPARDFAETGVLFLSYAEPAQGGRARTAVARARLAGDRLEDLAVLFRQTPALEGGRHFGSRIVEAPDGTLFITLGDRGHREMAQDPANTVGKLVRIAPDGDAPADNPFVGRAGHAPEIFSIGHRNTQGATLDAEGRLWVVAHGARGGDEINRPEAGRNYGWPVISYGRHYSGAPIGEGTEKPGMEQPLHVWDPSIAPSGLTVMEGPLFPDWRGDLFVGALRGAMIVRLEMADGAPTGAEERLFEYEFGRIRDVEAGPDGALWFVTDERDGALYRATPAD
jgi:glucose/arabinose dehydrogenase